MLAASPEGSDLKINVNERPFRFDALKDQVAAGAYIVMFVSVVFLIPAINLNGWFLTDGRLIDEKTGLERASAMA